MALAYTNSIIEEALSASCKSARILIVEDDPQYRFFLKQTLANHGYTVIEQAANGHEGYYKTLSFKPDLVILDLIMPVASGLDYCERIRAVPEFSDMPILVQTGVGDLEMHRKSFQAGATDLLTKPINPEEFIARTRAHLERYELLRNLEGYRSTIKQEMDVADSMQRYFMPSNKFCREIEQRYGVRISSHYQSSGTVGGDMWNLIPLDASRLLMYTCDFSGQGITSAMQSMRYHMLMQRIAEDTGDPGSALTQMNKRLCELLDSGQHTLMFLAVLDTHTHMLHYANAGAPRPLLLNPPCRRMEILPAAEPPLGIRADTHYTTHRISFSAQESLLAYSDALFSTCRMDGTCISEEEALLMANECLSGAGSVEEKHHAFLSCLCFNIEASNALLADDLLMLLISRA